MNVFATLTNAITVTARDALLAVGQEVYLAPFTTLEVGES